MVSAIIHHNSHPAAEEKVLVFHHAKREFCCGQRNWYCRQSNISDTLKPHWLLHNTPYSVSLSPRKAGKSDYQQQYQTFFHTVIYSFGGQTMNSFFNRICFCLLQYVSFFSVVFSRVEAVAYFDVSPMKDIVPM